MENTVSKLVSRNRFLAKVYGWMCLSLIVSAVAAAWFMQTAVFGRLIMIAQTQAHALIGGVIAFAVEMVVIGFISKQAADNSGLAGLSLLAFAFFDGCILSFALFDVSPKLILQAFIVTAATFASMSVVGLSTKKDLTSWSRQIYGALIAFIIVTFIEIFFNTPLVVIVMSLIGVVLFSMFVVFDTSRLVNGDFGHTNGSAISGALEMYLDFSNLFLEFVQLAQELFGNR